MPGWSNLMPMVIVLPPPEEPLSSFLSPPHAVAATDRESRTAEAAVTLRSFMVNFLLKW